MLLSLLFGVLETRARDVFVGEWRVSFTPDSPSVSHGARPFKDAALFHDGELSSEAFAMHGFHTVPYTVPPDAPSTFEASMTSRNQGTLMWSGRLEHGQITGLLKWEKPGGITLQYALAAEPFSDES